MKLKIVEIIEATMPPGPEREAALKLVHQAVAEIFAEGIKQIGVAVNKVPLQLPGDRG